MDKLAKQAIRCWTTGSRCTIERKGGREGGRSGGGKGGRGGREEEREGRRRTCSGSPFLAPPRICPSSTTSMLVTDCQRLYTRGGREGGREGEREINALSQRFTLNLSLSHRISPSLHPFPPSHVLMQFKPGPSRVRFSPLRHHRLSQRYPLLLLLLNIVIRPSHPLSLPLLLPLLLLLLLSLCHQRGPRPRRGRSPPPSFLLTVLLSF